MPCLASFLKSCLASKTCVSSSCKPTSGLDSTFLGVSLLLAGWNAVGLVWIVALARFSIKFKLGWTDLPHRNVVVTVIESGAVARVGHQTVRLFAHGRFAPRQIIFGSLIIVHVVSTGHPTLAKLILPVASLNFVVPDETLRTGHLHRASMNTAEVGMAVPGVGFEVVAAATVHMTLFSIMIHFFHIDLLSSSTGDFTVGQVRPITPLGCFAPGEAFRTGHLHRASMNTAEV